MVAPVFLGRQPVLKNQLSDPCGSHPKVGSRTFRCVKLAHAQGRGYLSDQIREEDFGELAHGTLWSRSRAEVHVRRWPHAD